MTQFRPETLKGVTIKKKTGCGNMYVTVNYDANGKPFELFSTMGKAGGCAASQCEGLGRLVSLTLRHSVSVEATIKQLKGIKCHANNNGSEIHSCADAIGVCLELALSLNEKATVIT